MRMFCAVLVTVIAVAAPESVSAQDLEKKQDELGATLPGVNLHDVTLMVQKLTGRKFLWTEDLGLRTKRVNFLSPDPIRGAENIFRVYQHFLQVNNLILVAARGSSEEAPVFKIQMSNTGSKQAIQFESGKFTPEDRFVSRLFHLKHVSPRDVHAALINMVSSPQAILQIESAGILLISDYDYNVQRLALMIEEMDKPKPDIVLKRVVLKNALASDVEKIMNNLSQVILSSSGGTAAVARGRAAIPSKGEQLKIVADTRTNSVIVLAAYSRIDRIVEIVRELDSETGFETSGIYIHHLKHTDAINIARTLNAMYKISIDESGVPSGGEGAKPGEAVAPRTPGAAGASASTPSGGSALTGTEPTIVADIRSNSIIMITDRNTYKSLIGIIQKLDSRRPQVLIKVSVIEVRSSDDFDLGMELARLEDPDDRVSAVGLSNFGYTTPGVDPSDTNEFALTPVDFTPGLTLALLKDKIGNIGALLRTSKAKARISVLDEPEVMTVDNGFAEVKVEDQIPILEATVTGTGILQTTLNRFETAETTLSISPHISEGGYLRLDLSVKIEKFTREATDPTIPPPKTSREITTNSILVPHGRTIVVGGIVTRDESDATSGVPILSDIPILGLLFKRKTESAEKRTLYIFMTPYILYDNRWGDLKSLTEERKFEIERLRRKSLERFQVDGPKMLRQRSTFRFTGPYDQ